MRYNQDKKYIDSQIRETSLEDLSTIIEYLTKKARKKVQAITSQDVEKFLREIERREEE